MFTVLLAMRVNVKIGLVVLGLLLQLIANAKAIEKASYTIEQANAVRHVSGMVVNDKGEPMPFVNVYVQGTTNGTTTNFDGKFTIAIQQEGSQNLVFQYIGYKKHVATIEGTSNLEGLTITMQPELIELPHFTVSAKAKDPAYGIIKNAIAKRKSHLHQVTAYSGDVYMKGVARLNDIPEKLPLVSKKNLPDSSDLGLIYLSESMARFHYKKPDHFKEEMLASKVSGRSQGFSWNRVADVQYNFYQNNLKFNGASEREFVSPIAATAMIFYKYKLLGTFKENGKTINKIQVIPKRKTDPIFHGNIYIVEDDWNIHSVDLMLTKDAQLEFIDTIEIKQSYVPIKDEKWMPLSLEMTYHYSIFGFDAAYNAIGMFSNYQLDKEFPDKFFNNEVFTIEANANKKDTSYWEGSRLVILTDEEAENYHEEDSLETLRKSEPYLDSLDREQNKVTVGRLLLGGVSFRNRHDSTRWGLNPLISGIQFNTVDGWVIDAAPWFFTNKGGVRRNYYGNLRYSVEREALNVRAGYLHRFNRINFSSIQAEGGRYTFQVNRQDPITPFVNSLYTLFWEENYMKLYESNYGYLAFQQEVSNGLFVKGGLRYENRTSLSNSTNFTFKDFESKVFSNNQISPFPNADDDAFTFELNVRYRFKQKYESYPHRKRIIGSKYPTVYFNYKKGIADALGSDVDYDFVSIGLGDDVKLGHTGISKFDVSYGKFVNNNAMSVYDYQHFNGNQTLFLKQSSPSTFRASDGSRPQLSQFHTLGYYTHSTNLAYLEAHYEHHFNGFIFNKFPLLRKLRFQAVGGINFLYTDAREDYTELFVGIENILQVFRIDVASFYENGGTLTPVVRFGLGLDF